MLYESDRILVSLELNIRQLILSDLAASIGEAKSNVADSNVVSAIDLITSKVETRVAAEEANVNSEGNEDVQEQRVFMVRWLLSRIGSCLIALAMTD